MPPCPLTISSRAKPIARRLRATPVRTPRNSAKFRLIVPPNGRWCSLIPVHIPGSTSTGMSSAAMRAARIAISHAVRVSVITGRCGPCCSKRADRQHRRAHFPGGDRPDFRPVRCVQSTSVPLIERRRRTPGNPLAGPDSAVPGEKSRLERRRRRGLTRDRRGTRRRCERRVGVNGFRRRIRAATTRLPPLPGAFATAGGAWLGISGPRCDSSRNVISLRPKSTERSIGVNPRMFRPLRSAPRLIASRAAAISPRLIASNNASVGCKSTAGDCEGATLSPSSSPCEPGIAGGSGSFGFSTPAVAGLPTTGPVGVPRPEV